MDGGTLYLVGTPIGNLEDLTPRALRVLREVAVIAAEDTRTSRVLLGRHGVSTPTVSYFEGNRARRGPELLRRLLDGSSVAVVSEAGMPGISDPGAALVQAAVQAGVRVTPIPGASAVTTAVAASGLPTDGFVFLGFLPRRPGRWARMLSAALALGKTVVWFESPHRLRGTLSRLAERWPEARVCLAREMTKLHEQFVRGSPAEVLSRLGGTVKGECTLLMTLRQAGSV